MCNVGTDFFCMVVRHSHLIEDALQRTRSKHFSPSKRILVSTVYQDILFWWCKIAELVSADVPLDVLKAVYVHLFIQVEFTGEEGTDTGGLRREFFRLLRTDMSGAYLIWWISTQHLGPTGIYIIICIMNVWSANVVRWPSNLSC